MKNTTLCLYYKIKWFVTYFCLDVAEAPYSCIGKASHPTIVGWEDTPQVGSLLPVDLGTISNGRTPNTTIGVKNSRISIRVSNT